MCINPIWINGANIPCQKCWQCRENRVTDWVGRCVAESKTAFYSSVGCLTYGRDENYNIDHVRARNLIYSDVQKFLKLVRWWNVPLRYFVVGEFGSEKGRAHWHIVAFWQQKLPPKYQEYKRYDHYFDDFGRRIPWPHGFTEWEPAQLGNIKYVMKYILKNYDDIRHESVMGLSRMPPLGYDYFRYLALLHVEQGLSPRDLYYGFPENRNKKGDTIKHYLRGASAWHYLRNFDEQWQMKYHNQNWPNSDLMDLYVDERERRKRRKAGEPDIPVDVFDQYYRDTMMDIKKHFGEGEESWTLPIEGAARGVEQLISQSRYQSRNQRKAG